MLSMYSNTGANIAQSADIPHMAQTTYRRSSS